MARKVIFKHFIVFSSIISLIAILCIAYASSELVRQTSGGIEQAKLSIISIIQQNNFIDARVQTQKLVADFPGEPNLPEALYEIAASECEWRPELGEEAKSIYQQIIQNYPDSSWASKAKLGILRADVLSPIMLHDYNRAEEALDKLIADFSEHPYFPETLYWIARAYERQLKMEYAKSIYQQIIQNYPDSSWASEAKLGIARTEVMSLILLNDYSQSKEAIDKLIAGFNDHPNFPETLYWVAERYRWAREYGEAKNIYKQIMQNYPDSSWASKARLGFSRADALSLINSRNRNRLEETVDKLIVDFNDHLDLPETLYWIAQECEWMMKLKEANSIYKRVIDCCPESPWADKARLGISRVNIGGLVETGDLNAAEPEFEKLIVDFNDSPDLAQTLYWLAQRYQDVNSFEKTKDIYQEILQRWPDSEHPGTIQIDIPLADIFSLIRSGEHAEALKALDKLIADFKGRPDLPKAVFIIGEEEYYKQALQNEDEGLTDQAKANFARAVLVWDRIITQLPESELTILQNAYYFVAACYRRLDEHEKAIKYFQEVVDNWPGYQYAWSAQCLIGECYEKLQKSAALPASETNPQIEQAYKAVIEKYPDCSLVKYACLKLGHIYYDKGQWSDAAKYFELFLEKVSDAQRRVNVLYDLGQTYEKMGISNQAAEMYRTFIETADPKDPRIETAKAKIEELKGQVK